MWIDSLMNINDSIVKNLNLRYELHLAIYIITILKDKVNFSLQKNKLIIQLNDKEITNNEFFYWWQITRYNEINNEEQQLIRSFEEIQQKTEKLKNSLFKINESDSDKELEKKQKKNVDINIKLKK